MNTKVTYILILLSVVVFGWLMLRRPSGHDTLLNQQNESHQQRIDSLNKVWADSLHRQELKALAVFQEYVRKLDRAEGEVKAWKIRYNHEKNSNRHFSDPELDSLVSAIR